MSRKIFSPRYVHKAGSAFILKPISSKKQKCKNATDPILTLKVFVTTEKKEIIGLYSVFMRIRNTIGSVCDIGTSEWEWFISV